MGHRSGLGLIVQKPQTSLLTPYCFLFGPSMHLGRCVASGSSAAWCTASSYDCIYLCQRIRTPRTGCDISDASHILALKRTRPSFGLCSSYFSLPGIFLKVPGDFWWSCHLSPFRRPLDLGEGHHSRDGTLNVWFQGKSVSRWWQQCREGLSIDV